ncbi:MAG: DUF1924 domain-containing protein [Thiobacillus sp.]|nr:DUF1924 domain-containing protein [Thiobacillus sp.]
MKTLLLSLMLLLPGSVLADSQAAIAEQLRQAANGQASATRGEQLFRARTGVGEAASCTDCHTDNPRAIGSHIRTRKAIEPLAPVANPARFTDMAKVEKWFRRNCQDVLGRACTAGEKADFAAYMIAVR